MRSTPLRLLALAAAVGATVTATAACSSTPNPSETATPDATTTATAEALVSGQLIDPTGAGLGNVMIRQAAGGMELTVQADGLQPGFHGLHLHAVGRCEANSANPADPGTTGNFLSSGPHLDDGNNDHPDHAGDLPSLYVGTDGNASLTTTTDRLTQEMLTDPDGVALIVHENPDNYANIPTRYASAGPDQETGNAGDAGARVACAALTTGAGTTSPGTPTGTGTATGSTTAPTGPNTEVPTGTQTFTPTLPEESTAVQPRENP